MLAVKGIYENGVARPLEKVDIKGKRKVIINFLDDIEEETRRKNVERVMQFAGMWSDLSEEEEGVIEEIVESRKDFSLDRGIEL